MIALFLENLWFSIKISLFLIVGLIIIGLPVHFFGEWVYLFSVPIGLAFVITAIESWS